MVTVLQMLLLLDSLVALPLQIELRFVEDRRLSVAVGDVSVCMDALEMGVVF
jgi:hypothetical protein